MTETVQKIGIVNNFLAPDGKPFSRLSTEDIHPDHCISLLPGVSPCDYVSMQFPGCVALSAGGSDLLYEQQFPWLTIDHAYQFVQPETEKYPEMTTRHLVLTHDLFLDQKFRDDAKGRRRLIRALIHDLREVSPKLPIADEHTFAQSISQLSEQKNRRIQEIAHFLNAYLEAGYSLEFP